MGRISPSPIGPPTTPIRTHPRRKTPMAKFSNGEITFLLDEPHPSLNILLASVEIAHNWSPYDRRRSSIHATFPPAQLQSHEASIQTPSPCCVFFPQGRNNTRRFTCTSQSLLFTESPPCVPAQMTTSKLTYASSACNTRCFELPAQEPKGPLPGPFP